jgi:chaperonin GroEL (HSP60 family)
LKNARFEELGRAATAEITPTHLTLTTSSSHPPTLAQIILGAPDHHPQTFRAFRQAIAVTQAAHRKGVVPGGGVALWRAAQSLPPSPAASILQTATEAPIRNLIHASGLDPSPRLAELLTLPPTHGFNLLTEQIEDLTLAPILDPLLILETVLTQAVHQTGQILLTDLLIFSEK